MKEIYLDYEFKGKLWRYQGPNSWYFVSAPKALSKKIRKVHFGSEEGWGRVKSEVKINETEWKTSIWFDTKLDCFLVPIKADIRRKENLKEGSQVQLQLRIEG